MLDAFHNTFVPEAVKHDGYIRREDAQAPHDRPGTRRPITTTVSNWSSRARSFDRMDCVGGHQRVWPLVERTMTTQKDYPVVLYDEV